MAKAVTLSAFFATLLAWASQVAPAAAPQEPVQAQIVDPSPLHSLTGVTFHLGLG